MTRLKALPLISLLLLLGQAQLAWVNGAIGQKDSSPSPPSSIVTVSTPGRITLFFPKNPESDIAGYDVYRSIDPDLPKDQWTKLNKSLLTRTKFIDDKVESGKKYFYYLTATDTEGKRSKPSIVVFETVL